MWLNRKSSWVIEETKEGSLLYLGLGDAVPHLLLKTTHSSHM